MAGIHRRRKRETNADQYAAMLIRMIRGYEKRIGADPAANLVHLDAIETALAEAANVGHYTANKIGGHSVNELADLRGKSKQAAFKRVLAGEQIAQERERAERKHITMRKAAQRELPAGSTSG